MNHLDSITVNTLMTPELFRELYDDRKRIKKQLEDLQEVKTGLDRQVTDLQTNNTSLITNQRMWKNLYGSARALLDMVLIEIPLSYKIYERPIEVTQSTLALLERITLLEKDAWTQAGPMVREFLAAYEKLQEASHLATEDAGDAMLLSFLQDWVERFKHLFPRP